ncbi:MAG: 50S ribosomal protein L11 methyltransferase [Candidatus Magasanikbacteria bacterium]|nr:50S ribosomal protein L11 methyltransferase [Candidatus Magasanikbacteria bacterium]
MKLVFQFGSQPDLSRAELTSRFPELAAGHLVAGRFFIVDCSESPAWLMEQLGGVVKILEVVEGISKKPDEMIVHLADHILKQTTEKPKVVYGVSIINAPELKGVGIALKRAIQEQSERSVRVVVSRDPELSSATVTLEGLLPPRGVELVFLKDSSQIVAAQTVAVQAFGEWSERDYGRPGRDAKRGMLPPKLAKMMLNIALGAREPSSVSVYDPFCGSGTVLIEAALLGATRLFGSDILKQAVDDTKLSLEWTRKQFNLTDVNFDVFKHDATQAAAHMKRESADVIVAETFLGRPLKKGESLSAGEKQELVTLYNRALKSLGAVLKSDGRIVLAIPFQVAPRELLPLHEILEGTGFTVDPILNDAGLKTILYMRPDQRTGRQIVRLLRGV